MLTKIENGTTILFNNFKELQAFKRKYFPRALILGHFKFNMNENDRKIVVALSTVNNKKNVTTKLLTIIESDTAQYKYKNGILEEGEKYE